ncbi:hypothetical protein AAZV13_17G108900 [Glycine max]
MHAQSLWLQWGDLICELHQCSAMINSTRSKWLLEEHGHIKAGMTQGMVIHGIYVLCIYSPIPSYDLYTKLETLDNSFGWPNIFQLGKGIIVCETFWLQSDV